MMKALVYTRCFNHIEREAVARCPQCGRDYCRECVTEHERRYLCAACLKALTGRAAKSNPGLRFFVALFQLGAAVCLLWFLFYATGQALLQLPTEFQSTPSAIADTQE